MRINNMNYNMNKNIKQLYVILKNNTSMLSINSFYPLII